MYKTFLEEVKKEEEKEINNLLSFRSSLARRLDEFALSIHLSNLVEHWGLEAVENQLGFYRKFGKSA